jgi:hypothetical protein
MALFISRGEAAENGMNCRRSLLLWILEFAIPDFVIAPR